MSNVKSLRKGDKLRTTIYFDPDTAADIFEFVGQDIREDKKSPKTLEKWVAGQIDKIIELRKQGINPLKSMSHAVCSQ